jgi:hypothetical protein
MVLLIGWASVWNASRAETLVNKRWGLLCTKYAPILTYRYDPSHTHWGFWGYLGHHACEGTLKYMEGRFIDGGP